jgi:hypothetical protein
MGIKRKYELVSAGISMSSDAEIEISAFVFPSYDHASLVEISFV